MNKLKNIFVVMLFGIYSQLCSAGTNDIYIQMNGEVQSFQDAVTSAHGIIKPTDNTSKYLIELNGKRTYIDFSSEKDVRGFMASLYPENIFIKITFSNVLPGMIAYIDKEKYAVIDKDGNFDEKKFFQTMPGEHTIELRKSARVFASKTLNIPSQLDVKCSGKQKLECVVITK